MIAPWLEPDPDVAYFVRILGPEENQERTVTVAEVRTKEEAIKFALESLGLDETSNVECETLHWQFCTCEDCRETEEAFRKEQRRDDQ